MNLEDLSSKKQMKRVERNPKISLIIIFMQIIYIPRTGNYILVQIF